MTAYAGLDVHERKCHGVIMNESGEVLRDEKFENTINGIELFFSGFEDAQVVIEACYSWRPALERLEEVGLEVKLAHPYKVRAIAEAVERNIGLKDKPSTSTEVSSPLEIGRSTPLS